MGLKVEKCCCCIDLRIGCIVIGAVGLILSFIFTGLNPSWSGFLGLILAIIANGCLIFAAAYTSGTVQIRSITTLVYMILILINALIVLIGTILICVAWGQAGQILSSQRYSTQDPGAIHGSFAASVIVGFVWIILDLYFALVAFSFYGELKSGNTVVTGGPA